MIMRKTFLSLALALASSATLLGCADVPVDAGEPALNVSPSRHGNLAAAQSLLRGAYDKLSDAQASNGGELGGHAARAKELLREAADEVKLAAITANER
jgi:hypothetical protein